MAAILKLELAGLYRKVSEAGYSISLTRMAKEFLCDKGYDPAYGARPLKRAVRRYLEDLVAECILSGLKPGSCIKVDLSEDGTALTIHTSSEHTLKAQPKKHRIRKKTESVTN